MRKKNETKREIHLSDRVKPSYRFDYHLSYDEAYRAFRTLATKRGEKFQILVGLGLTAVVIACLILFLLDNRRVNYFFIAIVALLMLFYLIYSPILKSKRGARAVQKAGGHFKVEVRREGTISLPKREPIELAGDKDARTIELDDMFVIRPDLSNTYCIPKRIIKPKELDGFRELLAAYTRLIRK